MKSGYSTFSLGTNGRFRTLAGQTPLLLDVVTLCTQCLAAARGSGTGGTGTGSCAV